MYLQAYAYLQACLPSSQQPSHHFFLPSPNYTLSSTKVCKYGVEEMCEPQSALAVISMSDKTGEHPVKRKVPFSGFPTSMRELSPTCGE